MARSRPPFLYTTSTTTVPNIFIHAKLLRVKLKNSRFEFQGQTFSGIAGTPSTTSIFFDLARSRKSLSLLPGVMTFVRGPEKSTSPFDIETNFEDFRREANSSAFTLCTKKKGGRGRRRVFPRKRQRDKKKLSPIYPLYITQVVRWQQ